MQSVIHFLLANWTEIFAVYGAAVALASTIVKLTPTQADDTILAHTLKAIDWLSTVYPKK